MRSCPTIERQGAVARAVGCLGNPQGLERFDTGAGGGILNRQAQVLELVADGVGQIPVLGGTGLGAGLEDLGGGLVHVVTRVGDQAGGNAQQAQRQLDLGLGELNAKRIEQIDQRIGGGKRGGLVGSVARLLQVLVALGHKAKDGTHGTGSVKVVVHALLKGGTGLGGLGGKRLGCRLIGIGRRMARGPAQVLDRTGA